MKSCCVLLLLLAPLATAAQSARPPIAMNRFGSAVLGMEAAELADKELKSRTMVEEIYARAPRPQAIEGVQLASILFRFRNGALRQITVQANNEKNAKGLFQWLTDAVGQATELDRRTGTFVWRSQLTVVRYEYSTKTGVGLLWIDLLDHVTAKTKARIAAERAADEDAPRTKPAFVYESDGIVYSIDKGQAPCGKGSFEWDSSAGRCKDGSGRFVSTGCC